MCELKVLYAYSVIHTFDVEQLLTGIRVFTSVQLNLAPRCHLELTDSVTS